MKINDLDHAFAPTPKEFSTRIDTTLRTLKEEAPMKKFTLRTAFVAMLYTLLFCSIAYAMVLGQNGNNNRMIDANQQNDPVKQQAITSQTQNEGNQNTSQDSLSLVYVTLPNYTSISGQNLITLYITTRVKDESKYELHPMTAMDQDNNWSTEPNNDNKDIRTEHWLTTKKGVGLPHEVMNDPGKALLLIHFSQSPVLHGTSDISLTLSSYNSFTEHSGNVTTVMQIDLNQLGPDDISKYLKSKQPNDIAYLRLGDSGRAIEILQQRLLDLGYYKGEINGLFSSEVYEAVVDFQLAHSLFGDGVAGPATQEKVYSDDVKNKNGDAASMIGYLDAMLEGVKQEQLEHTYRSTLTFVIDLPYQIIPFENGSFGTPSEGVAELKVLYHLLE